VIPKLHIPTLNDLKPEHAGLLGKLYLAAQSLAKRQGFDKAGYRTVINCNADAGQSVFHIHMHLLAGRVMGWPPFPTSR
jgi:histidine triad (HIT) family protein